MSLNVKICDITIFYAPTSGGVKRYLTEKARFLTEARGWSHLLIVPGPADAHQGEERQAVFTVAGPLVPGHQPYRLLLNLPKVRRILREQRPDLIEVGSPYLVPWLALIGAWGLQPVWVGFYHADLADTYIPHWPGVLGRFARAFLQRLSWYYIRLVYQRFAVTIAASRQIAEKLRGKGIRHVQQIPLGVDVELFQRARRCAPLRRQILTSPTRRLLLYVGRLASEKGIQTLLQAYSRFSPEEGYHLVVVGDGPLRDQVKAYARSRTDVSWAGYITDPVRLATYYASADLVVVPGPWETFALTALEAQACGVPVVGVRDSATAELILPEAGALFEAANPDSLAAAILETTGRTEASWPGRLRAHVQQSYTWPVVLGQLADVYERLVEGEVK